MPDAAAGRPRLLVLTSTLPRWENDSEPRFVLDLAVSMVEHFDPLILAPMARGAAPIQRTDGVSIRRYRYAPFRSWERLASPGAIMPNLRRWPVLYALVPGFFIAQFCALVRLLTRERFDVVHCHWIIPQGLVLAVASLFVTVPPALVTCHGADAFTLNARPFRRLKEWILRQFAAVSVVSGEIADNLGRTAGSARAASPVHIPMGVDLAKFANDRQEQSGPPIILYAGRLAPKKGVGKLLGAFADPRIQLRNVQLRIVGDGPMFDELMQASKRLGLQDKVTFTGAVSHDRLAEEMQAATLFCAPFIIAADGDREGTPTVLLEAAASGLPIITSDIGGCSEVVMAGRAGWLLPPGDSKALVVAIVDALDNPDRARRFAEAAKEHANRYSWRVIANRHVAVLDRLLSEAKESANEG